MTYPFINRHIHNVWDKYFLDANESKFSLKSINLYPEPFHPDLQNAIRKYFWLYWFDIKSDSIFPTIWAEGAIDNLMRWAVKKNLIAITCPPSFILYDYYINDYWIKSLELPLSKLDWLKTGTFNSIIDPQKYIIFLSSPWNPNGQTIKKDSIIFLLKKWFYIVLDEAYIHFSGFKNSLLELTRVYDKLFIIQSFSKWFWAPWLRLWYIVCNNKNLLIDYIHPYELSNIVSQFGQKLLSKVKFNERRIQEINFQRDTIYLMLKESDFTEEVVETCTNFILFKPKEDKYLNLLKHISSYNISFLELWFDDNKWYLKWFIRITIWNKIECAILTKCFNEYKN